MTRFPFAINNQNNTSNETCDGEAKSGAVVDPSNHCMANLRDGENVENKNLLRDDPINACEADFPVPDEESQGNDSSADNKEGTGNDDDEWNQFVHSTTFEAAPNLSAYLDARNTREKAKEKFCNTLEEYVKGLNIAMTQEMIQDTVVAVHQEQGERFDKYEADIISTMKSNHFRRKVAMKKLEEANSNWDGQYKRLRLDLLKEQRDSSSAHATQDKEELLSFSLCETSENKGEPNWDDMVGHFPPCRDNVRGFLEARERLQEATEVLSHSLDEIHESFKVDAESIIQIILDFSSQQEQQCLDLERDIQFHIMQNCDRREALQRSLEESEKRSRGYFANLLSRLSKRG